MEIILLCASLSFILLCLLIFKVVGGRGSRGYRLPPSPAPALPILGHIHLLKPPPPAHRTLHGLAEKYGPIFHLRFGARIVVVVSSPDLVEECFTKRNDVVFANRPHSLAGKYVGYNHTTMGGAPYGEQWQFLRRLAAQELLCPARLNACLHIRRDEIKRLVLGLHKISSGGRSGFSTVELRPKLSEMTFNLIVRMIAGKRYFSDDEKMSEEGEKFTKIITKVFELSGSANPEDFLPVLRWFDFRGLKKKLTACAKEMDGFFQCLVEEHRREKRSDTVIGHLLSLQQSEPQLYNDQIIKGLVMNMILAGTDSTSATLEWAMSCLLNHPNILQKATEELDARVGHTRLVEEQDLPNLDYLQNIISEATRLFPAGPLLLPHESSEDCRVGGYDVPRGTILLVNAWAIHRDPQVWDEPLRFKPERFECKVVEPQILMVFGMGRRSCPGTGLAQRTLGLALASLIQCFEWTRTSAEKIGLEEGCGGITLMKLNPLEVMCKPREIMNNVIKEASMSLLSE